MPPNIKEKRNIYLIGMPGSGKSTIGRSLAKVLQLNFIDADHALATRTGVAIATIFELEGEVGFRQREAALIAELCQEAGSLVATGGGAILSPISRESLRRTGVVVYLKAKLDDLWTRTKNDSKRPLLRTRSVGIDFSAQGHGIEPIPTIWRATIQRQRSSFHAL